MHADLERWMSNVERRRSARATGQSRGGKAGFVAYQLGDYAGCRDLNEKALAREPLNAYAMKGLGLALVRLGLVEEGIARLRERLRHSPPSFLDPYHDLALVLVEENRLLEAREVLEEGRARDDGFRRESEALMQFVEGRLKAADHR